jgi:hypothetical protein
VFFVEKSQYDLCASVLDRLDEAGILNTVVGRIHKHTRAYP